MPQEYPEWNDNDVTLLKKIVNNTAMLVLPSSGNAPASAGASGKAGEVAWDSSYFYVCVATDTWKRAALSSW